MSVQPQYLAYVLEQLDSLQALRPNRMFGGVGLYSEGLFFGLISDDMLYFKTAESNIADYRARNMPQFKPFPDKTSLSLGYHQVPAEVIEDAETLVAWARKAMQVALSRPVKKVRKTQAGGKARPVRKKSAANKPARKK